MECTAASGALLNYNRFSRYCIVAFTGIIKNHSNFEGGINVLIQGLSFDIPQGIGNNLWKILKGMRIDQYIWVVPNDQCDVWDASHHDFFDKVLFTGNEFEKYIQNMHSILFLKLQAYVQSSEIFELITIDDFYKSDCILLLLIYDCEHVEVYSHCPTILSKIGRSVSENNFTSLKVISNIEDVRKQLNIL